MEQLENRHLTTQVAAGWMMFFMAKVFALAAAILFGIYDANGFRTLSQDPGPEAARVVLFVLLLVSMMPIYVFIVGRFKSALWRWPVVLLGSALLLVGMLHHWGHWVAGELVRPSAHVVHLMATGAALWIVCSSLAWARHGVGAR
jgi:hypothetical protein